MDTPQKPNLSKIPTGSGNIYLRKERILWAKLIKEYHHDGSSAFVIQYDNNTQLAISDQKEIAACQAEFDS